MLVLKPVRRVDAVGAELDRVPVGELGIGHAQRDGAHAVAVAAVVLADFVLATERPRDHEADPPLFEHV